MQKETYYSSTWVAGLSSLKADSCNRGKRQRREARNWSKTGSNQKITETGRLKAITHQACCKKSDTKIQNFLALNLLFNVHTPIYTPNVFLQEIHCHKIHCQANEVSIKRWAGPEKKNGINWVFGFMQFSWEGCSRENFMDWSRSWCWISIFQDVSRVVWALVSRVVTTSEETENWLIQSNV